MIKLVVGEHVRFNNPDFAFINNLHHSHLSDGLRKILDHDEIPKIANLGMNFEELHKWAR